MSTHFFLNRIHTDDSVRKSSKIHLTKESLRQIHKNSFLTLKKVVHLGNNINSKKKLIPTLIVTSLTPSKLKILAETLLPLKD